MAVTNQDLIDLLTILYQASIRKSPLAVRVAGSAGVNYVSARFFRIEDIPTLASTYNLPLPQSDLQSTLVSGLSRGTFQKAIEAGTECGIVCTPRYTDPTIIYAYNPSMIRANPTNVALLDPAFLQSQSMSGSYTKFANNRAPAYGTRGYFSTSNVIIK